MDMKINTFNMTTAVMQIGGAESEAQLLAFKTKFKSILSSLYIGAAFLVAALWMSQPSSKMEMATLLIPAEAYDILSTGFSPVPSVAQEASKIPTNLVDSQAIDQNVLRSYAERQAVARYLANKYKIEHADSMNFVEKAIAVSREVGLDPTLILAVTAIESSFNPVAQSKKGAQGLMQVMTRVHAEKYQIFGGDHAALDPDANMRVGSLILREYIAKGGSLEAGLRLYVGASSMFISDGGYGEKVLAERERLKQAAALKVAVIRSKVL
jgi:soluble lytic murein transglycosylase-like protein